MKPGDDLGVWGWYLNICSICTKFGADLCVFAAKFAKTRKLNQTFAYNDMIEGLVILVRWLKPSDMILIVYYLWT